MRTLDRIVIVGGSLAGLRAAQALRERGFERAITVIGEELAPPYNRPPLSKAALRGDIGLEQLLFDAPESLDIEWRRGTPATQLGLSSRLVTLADGSEIAWDGLVIATGVKPRVPEIAGIDRRGVHFLRTFDDARRLRDDLASGARLTVIGAGFIGCEIAASARSRGLEVTIIDPADRPLSRILGPELGATIAELHRGHGVDLRLKHSVVSLMGADRVTGAVLDDGTVVAADVVVVGVGSVPAVDWLRDSGLEIGNGVMCDETCRALGGDGRVVAAGDVANWPHQGYDGRRMRVEHWTQAGEQAESAAGALLDSGWDAPFRPVLSLWSDQYDRKLQVLGAPWLATRTEVAADPASEARFFANCWDADRLMAVVGMNMPGKVAGSRQRVAAAMTPFGSPAPATQTMGAS